MAVSVQLGAGQRQAAAIVTRLGIGEIDTLVGGVMGREEDAQHAVLALPIDGGRIGHLAIFSPCWDTSQTGPTFSVISMRPSGRKAIRQGSLKVATVVMVKGRLASGFCSPTLTWAQAAADARVKSNAAFANFIVISPCLLLKRPTLSDPARGCRSYTTVGAVPNKCSRKSSASGARRVFNQNSSKPLARHYVIYGKCLTHWRVLLSVFFRSDLEHAFSFGRIRDNR